MIYLSQEKPQGKMKGEIKMTKTTVIKLEVTERELELIRSALCAKSMKELCKCHDIQRECQEKGIQDSSSHIYMDVRNEIMDIITKIDA